MKTNAAKALREPQESFAALAVAVPPRWHDAILRLAKATERVERRMDEMGLCQDAPTFQKKMRQMVDDLLSLLDGMDDDPDLEPTAGGSCDDECEPEETEPFLGWTTSGVMGDVNDLEQDDCDREDDDPDEAKQQPAVMA